MTFSKRTSSANNNFKLLRILKVSDLYQLNLENFMYKYNADILPSSFDNFFSKLHCIHDHGTRQVSGNYHHKHVRTDYGKKMPQYVGPVAWGCISNNTKMFSYRVKSWLLWPSFTQPVLFVLSFVDWNVFYCCVLTAQTLLDLTREVGRRPGHPADAGHRG